MDEKKAEKIQEGMFSKYIKKNLMQASEKINMAAEQRNIDAESTYDQPMFDLLKNWKRL